MRTRSPSLFRKAGFDVVETKLDLGNLEFKRVARDFTAAARDADIAVVYFAGHGIEVNGTNYLLPVDAKLVSDFDVEDEALSLDRVMRAIEPARRLRLVILDACRDNPFVRTMQRSVTTRNVSGGLAKVEPVIDRYAGRIRHQTRLDRRGRPGRQQPVRSGAGEKSRRSRAAICGSRSDMCATT